MGSLSRFCIVLLLAITAQGCATVGGKKIAAKKKLTAPMRITTESYALMDDSLGADEEISRRGTKARGLSSY